MFCYFIIFQLRFITKIKYLYLIRQSVSFVYNQYLKTLHELLAFFDRRHQLICFRIEEVIWVSNMLQSVVICIITHIYSYRRTYILKHTRKKEWKQNRRHNIPKDHFITVVQSMYWPIIDYMLLLFRSPFRLRLFHFFLMMIWRW